MYEHVESEPIIVLWLCPPVALREMWSYPVRHTECTPGVHPNVSQDIHPPRRFPDSSFLGKLDDELLDKERWYLEHEKDHGSSRQLHIPEHGVVPEDVHDG